MKVVQAGYLLLVLLPLVTACRQDAPGNESLNAPIHDPIMELRVGSLDDPEQALVRTSQLAIGPAGEMILGQNTELRVYDVGGALARRIGREGSGPGEFRQIVGVGLLGDTLWVYDLRERRYSYFGLDGSLLRTQNVRWTVGGEGDPHPPMAWGLYADGSIFGSPSTPSEEVALGRETETFFFRLDTLGAVVDTVGRRSVVNQTLRVADAAGPGSRMYFAQPYSDNELVQVAPNALELVRVDRAPPAEEDPGILRIARVGFDGDTLMRRDFVYRPAPIARSHVDSTVLALADRLLSGPMAQRYNAERLMSGIREGIYTPPFQRPVSTLLVGLGRTIWLRLGTPGDEGVWIGLSPEGEPLTEVHLPDRFSPLAATAGRMWGVQLDELDVPYLVRYRLEARGS